MDGANLKAETMAMMDKRAAMEMEMNSIVERLCNSGGPGLSGNLIDPEGFPPEDIDIPMVRAERRRLFCEPEMKLEGIKLEFLQRLAAEAQANQGQAVSVGVKARCKTRFICHPEGMARQRSIGVPFPFGMSHVLSSGGLDMVKASVLQSLWVMMSVFRNLNLVCVQVFAQLDS